MSTAVAVKENWEWTKEKEECLDLLLKGMPKLQIAKKLEVHRNTINNWTTHPAFMSEASARMAEHRQSVEFKRTREAGALTDLAGNYAIKAAKELEADPHSDRAKRSFREFSEEWRQNVRAEREILGINVQRIEQQHHHSGRVAHETTVSFKSALTAAVAKGAIDVEAVTVSTSKTPMEAVRAGVHALLSADDGEMLTGFHDADTKAAEAVSDKKRR